jgi:hypothetical protein
VVGGLLVALPAGCGAPDRSAVAVDWQLVGVHDRGRALDLQAIYGSCSGPGKLRVAARQAATTIAITVTRTGTGSSGDGACAIRIARPASVRLDGPVAGRAVVGSRMRDGTVGVLLRDAPAVPGGHRLAVPGVVGLRRGQGAAVLCRAGLRALPSRLRGAAAGRRIVAQRPAAGTRVRIAPPPDPARRCSLPPVAGPVVRLTTARG